jgi:hypothetical protein
MGFWSNVGNALNPLTPFNQTTDLVVTGKQIIDGARRDGITSPTEFYGNYGGPNYGSGTPIDGLDEAFQAHDRGYGDRNYFDLATDITFSAAAGLNALDPDATNRERLYGLAATSIFAVATPVSTVASTLYFPIKNADNPVEAAVNLAAAPLSTAAAAITGTAGAIKGFFGF